MRKCKCRSAPHYHREDCPIFDPHGNLKLTVKQLIESKKIYEKTNNVISFKVRKDRTGKSLFVPTKIVK